MKITRALLYSKGACATQAELFAEMFPDGVEVTEALCAGHASLFEWEWAARRLLPPAGWEEYDRAVAPARADFYRVRDAAWADCGHDVAPARADFDRVRAKTFGKLVEGL